MGIETLRKSGPEAHYPIKVVGFLFGSDMKKLSFQDIQDLVEHALATAYPPVAQGDDEPYRGSCRYRIGQCWSDRAFIHKTYYSLEADPRYALVTFALREGVGEGEPDPIVELGPLVPMKIQAISSDGKTAVELESSPVNALEAGRRHSKADAQALNAAMRAIAGLMTSEDLDSETISTINKIILKPNTPESDASEAWHGEEGETVVETMVGVIEGTFDKTEMVIRDHVVLGPISKNGYTYPVKTQQESIGVFEGAKAYLNHPVARDMGEARDVRDLIGQHKNIRVVGEKTYSDLYLVNNRTVQDHVLPIVESAPSLIGSSVVIRGKLKKVEGGIPEMAQILACRSIDLVSEPATTQGLYESVQADKSTEVDMELKDVTLEMLQKRPDLIEGILAGAKERERITTLEAEVLKSEEARKALETRAETAEKEKAAILLDAEIERLVLGAKLPDSVRFDEKDGKRTIKSTLSSLLRKCESSVERQTLIDDLVAMNKVEPKTPPVTTASSLSQEQVLNFEPKTITAESMQRLHSAMVN